MLGKKTILPFRLRGWNLLPMKRRGRRRLIACLSIITISLGFVSVCCIAFARAPITSYDSRYSKPLHYRVNTTWLIVHDSEEDVTSQQPGTRTRVVALYRNGSMRCSYAEDCGDISELLRLPETGSRSRTSRNKNQQRVFIASLPPSIRSQMAAIILAISEGAEWVYTGESSLDSVLSRLEDIKNSERKTGVIYSTPGFYHPVGHHYKHRHSVKAKLDEKDNGDDAKDDGDGDDDVGNDDDDDDEDGQPEVVADRYDVGIVFSRGVYLFHPTCLTQKYCLHSNPPIYLAQGSWSSLPAPRPMNILAHRNSFWFLITSVLAQPNAQLTATTDDDDNDNNDNGDDDRDGGGDEKTDTLIGFILQRLLWETDHLLAILPTSDQSSTNYNQNAKHSPRNRINKCGNEKSNDSNRAACKQHGKQSGHTKSASKTVKDDDNENKDNNNHNNHNNHNHNHNNHNHHINNNVCDRAVGPFYDFNTITNDKNFLQLQKRVFSLMKSMCASINVSFLVCAQKFISAYNNTATQTTTEEGTVSIRAAVWINNVLLQWLQILAQLDYTFPQRKPYQERSQLRNMHHKIPMWFAPSPCRPIQRFVRLNGNIPSREKNGTAGTHMNLINENLCQGSGAEFLSDKLHQNFVPQHFKISDILLIIVFNYPYLASHVPLLLAMYGRHFRHILFCGEHFSSFAKFYKMGKGVDVSFVEINHYEGTWGYSCMSAAIKMNYDVTGYLQMSDDVLLNSWNLEGIPRDQCWFQSRVRVADTRLTRVPDIATTNRWYPWIFSVGQKAANLSLVMLKRMDKHRRLQAMVRPFLERLKKTTRCPFCLMYEASDIFYVPKHLGKRWATFADVFQTNSVHLEIAIPSAIFGISPEAEVFRLRGNYIWGEDRSDFKKYYSPRDHFQHAFKLSRLAVQDDAAFFCKSYLSWIERDLIQPDGVAASIPEKKTINPQ